ncbi:MAG: 2-C-methyl-D-erythritol 4-phosphate cytidylyltransferase [Candidatus Omnitrophica bacterium]|nr:2-C-methyl-D-erythritol 4-phosphate cytidylyltransferase [Candidatus Omnitrophota bacterium]
MISVIIPAAGLGERFHQNISARTFPKLPKLYSELQGKPLITHALEAFASNALVKEIVVALEVGTEKRFRSEILSKVKLKKPILLVRGGKTRAESVWNALKQVSKESVYVCVHDGARPLVKSEWLTYLLKQMNGYDGAVLGRKAVPTIKVFNQHTGLIEQTLDREELFEAETPQLVKKNEFIKAYQMLGEKAFQATDDVSVIEAVGGRIKAVTHPEPNIKVTTYQDLELVRSLVAVGAQRALSLRFGLGFDRHKLAPKRPFYLGGIRLKTSFGPLGHSDGDPLLHAVTDGILGALGAGDIGDFFSDRNPKWKNAKSVRFLKHAVALASRKGFKIKQIDATIILERPKLGSKKKGIQNHLAKLLFLPPADVSIKAKTAEGFGPEGEGKAVSAQALVVLESLS